MVLDRNHGSKEDADVRSQTLVEGLDPGALASLWLMVGRRGGRARIVVVWALLGLHLLAHPFESKAANSPSSVSALVELPLERLLELEISTASGYAQPISRAPSQARVIDAEDIRAHGWTTLAEVLANMPGLYTSYDRSYTYLGTRGALRPGDYVSGFLLLIDGMRFNDPIYGQAAIGSDFPVDLSAVERVEYAPGPGSAAFGSNAYFGVINVVTRRPQHDRQAQVQIAVGSAGERRVATVLGGSNENGDDILLSAGRWRRDGRDLYFREFDLPGMQDGVARGLDGERGTHVLLRSHWRDWEFSFLHGRRDKDVPTASFDQAFGVPGAFVIDERSFVRAGYGLDLDASTRVGVDLALGRYRYWGDYLFDADDPLLRNRDGSTSRWLQGTVKVVTQAWDRHIVATGIDLQHDLKRRQYNYDLDDSPTILDDRSRGQRVGVYVSDEFQLQPGLWLNTGLRYDHNSETGGRLSPRLALIGERNGASYKAIAGQAFRSPNAYEMYYEDGEESGQLGNRDLRAEYIRTFELSAAWPLAPSSRIEAALYRYELLDLISQVVDENSTRLQFRNVDRATSMGGEVTFEHRHSSGLRLRAGYGAARLEGGEAGTLFSSPRHLFTLNAAVPLFRERLLLALAARHVHSREGLAAAVPGYTVVDVNLTWPHTPSGTEVWLRIGNLFDRRYADPVGPEFRQNAIEQDGRSLRFGIGYRF